MNLVVNQVSKFKIMHISDRYRIIKRFAGTSVIKLGFRIRRKGYTREVKLCGILKFLIGSLCRLFCKAEALSDIVLVRTVEYGCADVPAERSCRIAQVNLKHLTDVHT